MYTLRKNLSGDAIIGKVRETHMINPEKCLKCGACMEKCRFGAIYKE